MSEHSGPGLDENLCMQQLLVSLNAELEASGKSREWSPLVSLVDGTEHEPASFRLDSLPVVIFKDKRGNRTQYTTVCRIARIQIISKGDLRLEGGVSELTDTTASRPAAMSS